MTVKENIQHVQSFLSLLQSLQVDQTSLAKCENYTVVRSDILVCNTYRVVHGPRIHICVKQFKLSKLCLHHENDPTDYRLPICTIIENTHTLYTIKCNKYKAKLPLSLIKINLSQHKNNNTQLSLFFITR